MMLQPAMRSNWQVCDDLPFFTTRRGSVDVGGAAYPSIAVISISLPDKREGPDSNITLDCMHDLYRRGKSPGFDSRGLPLVMINLVGVRFPPVAKFC